MSTLNEDGFMAKYLQVGLKPNGSRLNFYSEKQDESDGGYFEEMMEVQKKLDSSKEKRQERLNLLRLDYRAISPSKLVPRSLTQIPTARSRLSISPSTAKVFRVEFSKGLASGQERVIRIPQRG